MRKRLTKKEKQARARLRQIDRKLEAIDRKLLINLNEQHARRNLDVGMYS